MINSRSVCPIPNVLIGLWVNRMSDPLQNPELWPHRWTWHWFFLHSNSNFEIAAFQVWMVSLIYNERDMNWHHDEYLGFLREKLKIRVSLNHLAYYFSAWQKFSLLPMTTWCRGRRSQGGIRNVDLFGAKPLPKPMLVYCQLDSLEQISVKFE